jgi:hypothetical protein
MKGRTVETTLQQPGRVVILTVEGISLRRSQQLAAEIARQPGVVGARHVPNCTHVTVPMGCSTESIVKLFKCIAGFEWMEKEL